MNRTATNPEFDPMQFVRAIVAWCASAVLLLLLSAAIISSADLKASSFPVFTMAILIAASFFTAFSVKRRSDLPAWQLGLAGTLGLTILLLTVGFIIAGRELTSSGVLMVAAGNLIGWFLGVSAANMTKKLQIKKRKPRKAKSHLFT